MTDYKKMTGALLVVLGLIAGAGVAGAAESYEHQATHRVTVDGSTPWRVENLLGSMTVRGNDGGDELRVEARILADGESWDDAKRLAESIELVETTVGSMPTLRVRFPADDHAAFRLPRSERDGLLQKWVTPYLRKNTVSVRYGDRSLEVGQSKGAAAVAVHLTVFVPFDRQLELQQVAGTLHAVALRGQFTTEVVEGQVLAEQIYGSLIARSGGGKIEIRKFDGDRCELHTASGDVDLIGVNTDELKLRTASGEVLASNVTTRTLFVQTGSGEVKLDDLDSETIEITTGSGSIDLGATIRRTRKASIESDTGDVVFRVSRATPFDLVASTGKGSIKNRGVEGEVLAMDATALHLQRGGGGADLKVSTGKGEVTVRPL